jgi:outer membrane protein
MTALRRAIWPALFALVAAGPGLRAQDAPMKFAYIDSRIILQQAPGAAAAQDQFNKERAAIMANVQKMQDSLQGMFEEYQKVQATLTADQKQAREKDLTAKQTEFQKRASELDDKVQQRQFELVQPIMNEIRDVLDKIRAEDGYTFIFDVGADGNPIVAADKNLDITQKVLARLKPLPVTVQKSDTSAAGPKKPSPAGIKKPPPSSMP